MAEKAKIRNVFLDGVKVVAFVLVVFLHTVTIDDPASEVVECLARIAVPVFFAVSGYFACKAPLPVIARRMGRIALLTAVAVAFFAIVSYAGLWSTNSEPFLESMRDWKTWLFNFFVYNNIEYAYHLWFLIALVYTYLFYYLVRFCRGGTKFFVGVAVVALAVRFVMTVTLEIIPGHNWELRNWLFMGVPGFATGLLVKELEDKLDKLSSGAYFCIVLVGIALSLIELKLFGAQELYLGSLVTAGALLQWSISVFNHQQAAMAERGETGGMSTIAKVFEACFGGNILFYAYVVHRFILTWLKIWMNPMLEGMTNPDWVIWIATAIVSIVIGALVNGVLVGGKRLFTGR